MFKQINVSESLIEPNGVCIFCDYPKDNDCAVCDGGKLDFIEP
ncbi:hypothetical protein [Paenibacillus sp. PK3_47]|nr:hypothetical protein [Paenibacillus sp. PK3_47]